MPRRRGGAIRTLDIFSGIGGHALALHKVCRPVAYCDIDPFARQVLEARVKSGDIPRAPIFTDVRELHGCQLNAAPEMLCGSAPCQDISSAGTQEGLTGARSSMFWEIPRLIDENPSIRVVLMENSPRIRDLGLSDIEDAFRVRGFTCACATFAASDVGARHGRKRWYFLAVREANADGSEDVISTAILRKLVRSAQTKYEHDFKQLEQDIPRLVPHADDTDNNTSKWTQRCSACGNAVLPQVVTLAVRVLGKVITNQRKSNPISARNGVPPPMVDMHGNWAPGVEERAIVDYPVLNFPLEYPKTQRLWSTPLHNATVFKPYRLYKKNFRNTGHIATRVFFERDTMARFGYTNIEQARKEYHLNPVWVEALMGFPKGWTVTP